MSHDEIISDVLYPGGPYKTSRYFIQFDGVDGSEVTTIYKTEYESGETYFVSLDADTVHDNLEDLFESVLKWIKEQVSYMENNKSIILSKWRTGFVLGTN